MEARELRIGNLVFNPIQNKIVKVDGSLISIEHSRELSIKDHKGFEPIPLTEEWLLKFSRGSRRVLSINGTGLWVELKNDGYFLTDDCGNLITYDEIKYVHSLQNLYFALTNEELTI
jgi:hypothetical protein